MKCNKLLLLLLFVCFLFSAITAQAAEVNLNRDIVVFFTNDVHAAVLKDGLDYASLVQLKKEELAKGNYVALVDCGDALQGAPIASLTYGKDVIDILNKVGYDVAVPGNHEFGYGSKHFLELANQAKFPYVSSNFLESKTGKNVFKPGIILNFGKVKIGFVGVTTPETSSESVLAAFLDEQGNPVYDFCRGGNGAELWQNVQRTVDKLRLDGADYVIALAHLGTNEESKPWTSYELIANTSGIDAVFDGHSHSFFKEYRPNIKGEPTVVAQTGTKFRSIGKLVLSANKIKIELIENKDVLKDQETLAYINNKLQVFQTFLAKPVGESKVTLKIYDTLQKDLRLIRRCETNAGDFCTDAYRYVTGADVAICGGGTIRSEIAVGTVSYNDLLSIFPFGNFACVAEVSGQNLLDALEMGARNCPEESGGFLQISGATYEIHTYLPSTVQCDTAGAFVDVLGEYRVKNVRINGQPLDLKKLYKVASTDYLIKNTGDGMSMFLGEKLLQDSTMADYDVLKNYIQKHLKGIIDDSYANPRGQQRIKIVEKP